MSDLRDRIAAAVYGDGWENAYPDDRNYWLTVADAVIAELGLEKQTLNRQMWAAAPNMRRYITEWEPDSE